MTEKSTTKTLLEHHYNLRIASLADNPRINYARRLVIVEMMANEHGWKYVCPLEAILNRVNNIYTA